MSRLQCRGSIARVAFVVALFSTRPADAQVVVPSPPRPHEISSNPFVTGVWYDVVNQAKAERRLQNLQAKLRRDAERGDSVAADRDVRRIDNVKYRIVVDEWLIRQNSLLDPGCYPLRIDTMSYDAIVQAARPAPPPYPPQFVMSRQPLDPAGLASPPYPSQPVPTPGPMSASPTNTITIVNAEPTGAGVAFAIDGVAHQAAGGSRQDLAVAPGSNITYDAGGSFGRRQYLITPGLYEFRSTPEGWALYKLPGMP